MPLIPIIPKTNDAGEALCKTTYRHYAFADQTSQTEVTLGVGRVHEVEHRCSVEPRPIGDIIGQALPKPPLSTLEVKKYGVWTTRTEEVWVPDPRFTPPK